MNAAAGPAPLWVIVVQFCLCAAVITWAGLRLTRLAEKLARMTGLGQLLTGALLIGLVTSLSGLVTSIAAAAGGHASLAVSNALGGIAAQTVFLVIADMVYREANLEHAAASESNLLQGVVLLVLLAMPVMGVAVPGPTLFAVHPVSVLLIFVYLFGLRLMSGARRHPMWRPLMTAQTQREPPAGTGDMGTVTPGLWLRFAALGALVAGAGWLLAGAAVAFSERAGMSQSLVGGVFTAVTTSLPELVVAIAAVRRGALALALGDILGGNAFDVLFISASDIFYREGSIYAALGRAELFWATLSILMVGVLLMGLLRREKHGFGNIGFESAAVLLLYVGGILTLILTGGLHDG